MIYLLGYLKKKKINYTSDRLDFLKSVYLSPSKSLKTDKMVK